MAADSIYVYINDELLSSCFVDSNYSVTSTGLTIMRGGTTVAEWTYSGSNQFLGFSNTQGSTTAEYGVSSTGILYDMQPTYGTLHLYSVSEASKLVDNIALSEFLTKSKQLFYHSTNPPPYTGLQTTSNLVTSISSSSTDAQYPSAKCVYDAIANAGGGGGSSDPFTVNYTITSHGQTVTYSVPRLQVDSILSNKPTILRIEHNSGSVYGYVLLSNSLNRIIYLPPNTTSYNGSNVITVTSSSFKYDNRTLSYNSSTDCYEYTESGGSND